MLNYDPTTKKYRCSVCVTNCTSITEWKRHLGHCSNLVQTCNRIYNEFKHLVEKETQTNFVQPSNTAYHYFSDHSIKVKKEPNDYETTGTPKITNHVENKTTTNTISIKQERSSHPKEKAPQNTNLEDNAFHQELDIKTEPLDYPNTTTTHNLKSNPYPTPIMIKKEIDTNATTNLTNKKRCSVIYPKAGNDVSQVLRET